MTSEKLLQADPTLHSDMFQVFPNLFAAVQFVPTKNRTFVWCRFCSVNLCLFWRREQKVHGHTELTCSARYCFIVSTGCLEPPFSLHPSWTCSSRPQRGSTTAVSCLFASCRAWWRYSRRKHSLHVKLFYVKRRFQSSQNSLATCFLHTAVLMEAAVTFYKYTLQLWNFMKANNSMLYQFHWRPVLTEVTSMFMLCPCKFKNKNKWLALLARHSALVQEAAVAILAENMLWMSPFQKNALCCQWKCKLDEKRWFWTWASGASRPAVRLTWFKPAHSGHLFYLLLFSQHRKQSSFSNVGKTNLPPATFWHVWHHVTYRVSPTQHAMGCGPNGRRLWNGVDLLQPPSVVRAASVSSSQKLQQLPVIKLTPTQTLSPVCACVCGHSLLIGGKLFLCWFGSSHITEITMLRFESGTMTTDASKPSWHCL